MKEQKTYSAMDDRATDRIRKVLDHHTYACSPWYNCNGWLGVKHQLTYHLRGFHLPFAMGHSEPFVDHKCILWTKPVRACIILRWKKYQQNKLTTAWQTSQLVDVSEQDGFCNTGTGIVPLRLCRLIKSLPQGGTTQTKIVFFSAE